MAYGKMKRLAIAGLIGLSVCCLSGCSFSFCGFPIGGREELVFSCSEEPTEAAGGSGGQGADSGGGASGGDSGSGESGAQKAESGPRASGGDSRTGESGAQKAESGSGAPGGQGDDSGGGESGGPASDSGISADGRVNINLAGLEELMTLNGVGETRAKAIMEYREENGPFQSIEDIMLIPGIKEGIFSKIKEQIAVD